MRSESVVLRSAPDGVAPRAALRELRGRDELAIDGVNTRAAVALLASLLEPAALASQAGALAATDRDALLAALHRQLWGDRIVSTLTCPDCGARYDLSFSLRALQAHLDAGRGLQGTGQRLPTADEEIDAAACGQHGGVMALAVAIGIPTDQIDAACAGLEADAPILDLELSAPCSECGSVQLAHFDLQSFLLQRLLGERALLLSEIHRLAGRYGWSLREILSLPRSTRRVLGEGGPWSMA